MFSSGANAHILRKVLVFAAQDVCYIDIYLGNLKNKTKHVILLKEEKKKEKKRRNQRSFSKNIKVLKPRNWTRA